MLYIHPDLTSYDGIIAAECVALVAYTRLCVDLASVVLAQPSLSAEDDEYLCEISRLVGAAFDDIRK